MSSAAAFKVVFPQWVTHQYCASVGQRYSQTTVVRAFHRSLVTDTLSTCCLISLQFLPTIFRHFSTLTVIEGVRLAVFIPTTIWLHFCTMRRREDDPSILSLIPWGHDPGFIWMPLDANHLPQIPLRTKHCTETPSWNWFPVHKNCSGTARGPPQRP